MLHVQRQDEADQKEAGGVGHGYAPDNGDAQKVIRPQTNAGQKVQDQRQTAQHKRQTTRQKADPRKGLARHKLPLAHRPRQHQRQRLPTPLTGSRPVSDQNGDGGPNDLDLFDGSTQQAQRIEFRGFDRVGRFAKRQQRGLCSFIGCYIAPQGNGTCDEGHQRG